MFLIHDRIFQISVIPEWSRLRGIEAGDIVCIGAGVGGRFPSFLRDRLDEPPLLVIGMADLIAGPSRLPELSVSVSRSPWSFYVRV